MLRLSSGGGTPERARLGHFAAECAAPATRASGTLELGLQCSVVRALLSAVEASYSSVGAGDVQAWLRTTVRALAPVLGRTRGVMGYTFDAPGSPERWSVSRPFVHDGSADLAPPAFRIGLCRAERRAHTLSELNGFTLEALPFGQAAEIASRPRSPRTSSSSKSADPKSWCSNGKVAAMTVRSVR